ncbi:TPA: hypothetical protein ACJIWA_001786 [Enterobacter bugandensis]|uniref:hypothetical protein n=1 Tax=Enterobacter TaxID=547 RepID=UPI000F88E9D2|nr:MULTISPECIES: hypothetical protein [Enterobacter]EHN8830318.1 hypothetical protein [Enterobacter bugandensis]EHN8848372.1 hypothetical protein [Enterobacter bugandensis]MBE4807849.1 hypothetical protein [Enterobacter cloacae complex sp. P43RS]MCK6700312.1 hypothetical protein [Enterobacter bugandensis]MCK6777426.1 hypothetical protein [Enterobacter bugandensis]
MERQYDNELTPELLARLNHSSFTAEELAELDDEVRALVAEQEASRRQHPIIAIYRPAVAGCLTRNGGTGDEFNPDSEKGRKIRLKNGVWASVLTESCTVSYPDGSHARIVSSAGNRNRLNRQGVAVVGSILDNGDEIISTPQGSNIMIVREGAMLPDDFLVTPGV